MTLGYDGLPPSLERREDHEDAGGSVALIFIIDTPRLAFPHGNGRARLFQQLLRGFVAITHPIFRVPIEGAAPGFRVPLATDSDL